MTHDVSLASDLTVAVVGLGKIGLPLAVQYASRGCDVVGADIDQRVVGLVNAGVEPFPGEANLADRLSDVVAAGRLRATTDTAAAVRASAVVVVVVPLIVDGNGVPDFRAMDAATTSIGQGLRPGSIVLYETTLPVFTTRHRFAPALAAQSGLTLGTDFWVAFSPERVFSGRIFADLRRYPKLVGGLDATAARLAMQFYERALEFDPRPDLARQNGVWDLGSAEAAELSKLAETTYRDVNIAFANDLALFAERAGIDVFSVIEAANSQPFSHIHLPGIAVGGHCIPVYPMLYLASSPDSKVPAASRAVNLAVPAHAVDQVERALGDLTSRRIAILGAAYRGGVKETAFSGVFAIDAALRDRGAIVAVHDPLFTDEELAALGFDAFHFGEPCEGAIVQTDHAAYRTMLPTDLPGLRVLYDGRNVTMPDTWVLAGVEHMQLGRGSINSST